MGEGDTAAWDDTVITDALLNLTTIGNGTSFPSVWATDRLFYRSDQAKLYYNSGTFASPIFSTFTVENHSHDAADVATGTLADARIPSLDASKTTTGTFADARIPNLDTSKLTTGTLPTARGGTGRTDITSAEYGYLNNATSELQAQIDGKIGIQAEETTTDNGGTGAGDLGGVGRRYAYQTIPSTHEFYYITHISWFTGAIVSGSFHAGVDIVDGNPAKADGTYCIAVVGSHTGSGANTEQKKTVSGGTMVRGGTKVGVWLQHSATTAKAQYAIVTSVNRHKSYTFVANEIDMASTVALTSTTIEPRMKLYMRGFG